MNKKKISAITLSEETVKLIEEHFRMERAGDKWARSAAVKDLEKFSIKTADGSYTLRSEECRGKSETMHTFHGALEESRRKFVEPSQIREKLRNNKEIRILDICSGLGYNVAATLELLNRNGELGNNGIENKEIKNKITIDMVEISLETLAAALLIPSPTDAHEMVKTAVEDKLYSEGYINFKFQEKKIPENVHINVNCQEVRNFIKKISKFSDKQLDSYGVCDVKEIYDIVFLDPFSPQMAPELYTLDFFKALRRVVKKDALLLTYTSAAPVRWALIGTGFHVGEGPCFGRKKGGTVASPSPQKILKELPPDDERMIALSDAGLPFRDPHLNDSGSVIAQRREDERARARGRYRFASTVKTPVFLEKELEDGRLRRRVLKNLQKLGFKDLKSDKSRYIVCPQYKVCICGGECADYKTSTERIEEMTRRLHQVINKLE
jgi:tRNA U34 5-methylaminomethyl-2-thiouridine-forming methyltransferase MnmC